MKQIVCFWLEHLGERGMCVSTFDYAYYNQKFLQNKSVILYNIEDETNDEEVRKNMENHFEIYGIRRHELDYFTKNMQCDLLYILKHGKEDDMMNFQVKTAIHAVFEGGTPHGDKFAVISKDVNNAGDHPVIPHMIDLPDHNENMRKELGIPEDALVFGRHGGYEQFNIDYVKDVVREIALCKPEEIYFVFLNTEPFCEELPNIIHLEKTIDKHKKVKFINTCDAMLWARSGGETFGLSIAEFSIKNKPVFCADVGSRAHMSFLKNKAKVYTDHDDLFDKILHYHDTFREDIGKDWNAYKEFTPRSVIDQFERYFLLQQFIRR